MTFDASFLFHSDRLEEGRRWQTELREKYGENKLPPAVRNLTYALRCIETVRQNIATQENDKDEEGLLHSKARLAELLIETGNFDEAVAVAIHSNRPDILERAGRLQGALIRDDSETCECKNLNSGLPTTFIKQSFMIEGVKKVQVKCSTCGLSNIRDLKDGDVATPEMEAKANNK